jgi:chaperonin GroEL
MITETKTKTSARKSTLSGVLKVYEPVRLTLGPDGVNALLPRTYNRGPRITNDGVTISENIKLKDPHEALAAEAFKEGSKKTNELAGDGTTTTAVIGGHLIKEIFTDMISTDIPSLGKNKNVKSVRAIRKELKTTKELVIEKIKENSIPVKTLADLEKIAIVSIGKEDEETAKAVAKLVWEIGRDEEGNFVDNHIDVVEGYKDIIETEVIKGMKFPAKAIRQFLTNPDRFEMVCEDVPVFITNYKIDNAGEFVDAFDSIRPQKIAVFAPDFSNSVLISFAQSWKAGIFIYPIKCPSLRTEQLEDLAAYTGATVLDKEAGRKLKSVCQNDLGFAKKIVVKDTENREDAVLIGGKGEKLISTTNNQTLIFNRTEILKGQMKEARDEFTKVSLQKRIANLSSAVGIIRVGATTSKEGLYLKLKIEDGQYACKSALQEGYVKGGGLCLKEIAEDLPDTDLLKKSLMAPYNQIQENSGDLDIGEDIIDPAKVVRLEVEHAVSVASTMITIGISIPEVEEMGPGEGYEQIAKAIRTYTMYWAKQQGMLKENEDLMEKDRNDAFEKVLQGDQG